MGRFSCKKIPVRFFIIALIALVRFSLMSMSSSFVQSWQMFVNETTIPKYWPFCKLTEDERHNKTTKESFGIWYNITLEDCGPRYEWSITHRERVRAVQQFGQMVGTIPSGIFVCSIGYPLYVVIYGSIAAAVLNCLRVILVSSQWQYLLVSEFFLGLHIGAIYPALVQWTARWAPVAEIAIFEVTHLANALGANLIRKLLHHAAPLIGYRGIYYYNSVLALISVALCCYVGGDDPETQRWISSKELDKIKFSQRDKVTRTRCRPPFQHFLASGAFWSSIILYFGMRVANVFYFGANGIYKYLDEFIGIHKNTMDLVDVVPYIGALFGNVLSATADNFLRSREIISHKSLTQIFVIISHIMTGIIIIVIGVAYCNTTYALVLMVIGYTCSGAAVVSSYRTIIDIAPNFAGLTYAIGHFFGLTTRLIIPKVMKYVFTFNEGVLGWSIIFLIVGGCITGTGIIYFFFGSSKCQWWNLKLKDQFRIYIRKLPKSERDLSASTTSTHKDMQKDVGAPSTSTNTSISTK